MAPAVFTAVESSLVYVRVFADQAENQQIEKNRETDTIENQLIQRLYTVIIITGPTGFQRHNLVNMRFAYTILSRPEREIMLCEVLSEFPKYVLPLPCNVCISVTQCDQRIDNSSRAVSSLSVLVSKRKVDTLNTRVIQFFSLDRWSFWTFWC